MYHNTWGGPLEIADTVEDDDRSRNPDLDRASLQRLSETQQSWLLGTGEKKKKNNLDLGCMTCSKKLFKGFVFTFVVIALIVGITVLIVKFGPRHHHAPPPPENYTIALHKALLFFNAQKSGILPRSNNISYRGNSGLKDGFSDSSSVDLVGGYYDAGDNIKFHFPAAFTMTLLSWSVIEYSAKYKAAGELDHVKELIKWGTDYLLKTFNSSATRLDYLYAQVGQGGQGGRQGGQGGPSTPNDHYCWERPEDMDYPRPVARISTGSDLAAEMAAALAASSIVFKDNVAYSRKLVNGAKALFQLSRDRRGRYSASVPDAAMFYNSTGYYDEFLWGGAWMYYATGNTSYLQLVTTLGIGKWAGAYGGGPYYGVFDWDNKLAGAQVLLTRLRLLQYPGYPYDEVLKNFNNQTNIVMCSYLPVYKRFLRTPGGLSVLNRGNPAPLQYTVNAAFLASLYADYLDAGDIPGWYCGPTFYLVHTLRDFAKSQMNYVLGQNPLKMSYVVGFGDKYPRHVHHRAASIPKNGQRYGCTEGWRWRDSKSPNPNTLVGAMVGGPDLKDHFQDSRTNYNYTEPTIAGNAGLVAALVALSGNNKTGIDAATLFSRLPPMFPSPPPPAAPWVP